jgi:hypothetical protein
MDQYPVGIRAINYLTPTDGWAEMVAILPEAPPTKAIRDDNFNIVVDQSTGNWSFPVTPEEFQQLSADIERFS